METDKPLENDQAFRQKVLETFFQDGRLKVMPVKRKKRLVVLDEIVERFAYDRVYSEKEVNEIITEIFDDYCTVRRELVDERMMGRDRDGYWRVKVE